MPIQGLYLGLLRARVRPVQCGLTDPDGVVTLQRLLVRSNNSASRGKLKHPCEGIPAGLSAPQLRVEASVSPAGAAGAAAAPRCSRGPCGAARRGARGRGGPGRAGGGRPAALGGSAPRAGERGGELGRERGTPVPLPDGASARAGSGGSSAGCRRPWPASGRGASRGACCGRDRRRSCGTARPRPPPLPAAAFSSG